MINRNIFLKNSFLGLPRLHVARCLLTVLFLIFGVLLFFISGVVHSADIEKFSFQFSNVRLYDLTRVVLSDVSKKNYVLSPDLLADASEFSLDLRAVTSNQMMQQLEELLDSRGFSVREFADVLIVEKKIKLESEREIFFYRLKNRSITYIADLLGSLFENGRFTFQRGGQGISGQFGSAASASSGAQPSYGNSGAPAQSQSGSIGSSSAGASSLDQDAFIYRGSIVDVERLKGLLAQVDVPGGEVTVKAIVFEVATNSNEGSAVQLAGSILGGRFGVSFGTGSLLNSATVKLGGLEAVFSALSSDSRFKVVSAPSMRVKSGSSARFSVGNEVPGLGAVSYQQNGAAVQSVVYKPSGVILDVRPSVRESGIDLTIFQQISTFAVTDTGVNTSPTLSKRELSTTIGVKSGELVVLGGLDDSRDTTAGSGLPFLPRWLFSSSDQKLKTEILLVLDVQRI